MIQKLWAAKDRISHHGKHYQFDDVRITPKPIQNPMPAYIGSFSKPSIELAARLGYGLIVAPFAAAMSYGGLKQVADLYNETCIKHGKKPGRLMCSYFTHFYDNAAAGGGAARAPDPLLQGMRDPGAARAIPRPRRRATTISSTWSTRLHKVKPEMLTDNSVLLGNSQQITDIAEEGRGRGLLRGHPLLQRRHEAAPAGQGRDGPLHARGGAAFPGQAHRAPRGVREWLKHTPFVPASAHCNTRVALRGRRG